VRIRRVDAAGDMLFGQGQANFWRDVPDAPAQLASSRLHLEQGEWFLDTSDGTPWRTRVLGNRTAGTRDPVIRSRILGTQGVKQIVAYDSVLDRETRGFAVQATIETAYGQTQLREPL
jgi:hypothetical protein